MLKERGYYTKFKKQLESDNSLLEYFSKLNTEDWIEFFNDYYNHYTTYLLRIIDTPKGEDIYSYGLVLLDDVDTATRKLIAKANNSLLADFYNDSKWDLTTELLNTVRYLELNISANLLIEIISNEAIVNEIREHAAITLSVVHEISLVSFWDGLDLTIYEFLIPSYISFFEKTNPLKGLSKLLLLHNKPEEVESFESPILYSLQQIGILLSDIVKYRELEIKFPDWVKTFIEGLLEDYPSLNYFRESIEKPYEGILKEIGLDYQVYKDETLPEVMKKSLDALLYKLKTSDKEEQKKLINVFNQRQATIIDPLYIYELENGLNCVKAEIKSLLGNDNVYDPTGEKVYEPLSNTLLYKQPVIFLYPYFLDENRMNSKGAGVIPYAKQTRMSIVIHKKNPIYYQWQAIRETKLTNEIIEDLNKEAKRIIDFEIEEFHCIEWLKNLLMGLQTAKGSIYSVTGYIFDSLIQQFVEKEFPTEYQKMTGLFREPTPIEAIKTLPFYNIPKLNENDAPQLIKVNDILLLDPADALGFSINGRSDLMNSNLSDNYYDIITVKHGLDVFVGVGFTLFALPRLLKDKRWKKIENLILKELTSDKELLDKAGIELFETQNTKILI